MELEIANELLTITASKVAGSRLLREMPEPSSQRAVSMSGSGLDAAAVRAWNADADPASMFVEALIAVCEVRLHLPCLECSTACALILKFILCISLKTSTCPS